MASETQLWALKDSIRILNVTRMNCRKVHEKPRKEPAVSGEAASRCIVRAGY
jgi:hypothetical protein